MVAVEAWWIWLAWPFLTANLDLVDPELSAGQRPVGVDLGEVAPGFALVLGAPPVLAAIMALLAIVGIVRRLRAGHWDLDAACLAAAPVLILAFQAYGGEGPLRVYLFALPWLAFFAAAACLIAAGRRRRSGALRRAVPLGAAAFALGACLLLAYFGREAVNHIGQDEVRAATWYERHAPRRAVVLYATAQVPDRLTADYQRVQPGLPMGVVERGAIDGHPLGPRDVPALARLARRQGSDRVFLILSDRQGRYGWLYGLLPDGSIDRLTAALRRSKDFRLVLRRGSAWIFRYRPVRAAGSAA
jgi:hypothetical protein